MFSFSFCANYRACLKAHTRLVVSRNGNLSCNCHRYSDGHKHFLGIVVNYICNVVSYSIPHLTYHRKILEKFIAHFKRARIQWRVCSLPVVCNVKRVKLCATGFATGTQMFLLDFIRTNKYATDMFSFHFPLHSWFAT